MTGPEGTREHLPRLAIVIATAVSWTACVLSLVTVRFTSTSDAYFTPVVAVVVAAATAAVVVPGIFSLTVSEGARARPSWACFGTLCVWAFLLVPRAAPTAWYTGVWWLAAVAALCLTATLAVVLWAARGARGRWWLTAVVALLAVTTVVDRWAVPGASEHYLAAGAPAWGGGDAPSTDRIVERFVEQMSLESYRYRFDTDPGYDPADLVAFVAGDPPRGNAGAGGAVAEGVDGVDLPPNLASGPPQRLTLRVTVQRPGRSESWFRNPQAPGVVRQCYQVDFDWYGQAGAVTRSRCPKDD